MLKSKQMRIDMNEKELIEILRFIKKTDMAKEISSTLNGFINDHNVAWTDNVLYSCMKVLMDNSKEFSLMIQK